MKEIKKHKKKDMKLLDEKLTKLNSDLARNIQNKRLSRHKYFSNFNENKKHV